ncbi:unnamed protein product [Effrenium voratum]|nr:unnamed protein product [Effrenium voratum]
MLALPAPEEDSAERLRTTVEAHEDGSGLEVPVKFKGPEARLHVYDLLKDKATTDRLLSLGLGFFHASVEVYGAEWSFGRHNEEERRHFTGIFSVLPMSYADSWAHREAIPLGSLRHTPEEVWNLLKEMAPRWRGDDYKQLKRNCLHFCTEFCDALGLKPMPSWVSRLASIGDVVLSPLVAVFDFVALANETEEAEKEAKSRSTPALCQDLTVEKDFVEREGETLSLMRATSQSWLLVLEKEQQRAVRDFFS